MKAIVVFLIACIAISCAQTVIQPVGKGGDNSWDYMLLVVDWSGSACIGITHECEIPDDVDDFTLHGLWPNRNDNSYPQFCNDSDPFDPQQVSSVMSEMRQYWTDYYDATGTSFWEHEWDKHGTCAMSDDLLATQLMFFTAALRLRTQANILAKLEDGNIYPNTTVGYAIDDLRSALNDGKSSGNQCLVYCSQDKDKQTTVLNNVQFCVDKNLQFMACPDALMQQYSSNNGCDSASSIMFPPAHSDDL
eukprot:TRINITY_DN861_c0_g1_i1.p1 TRINITY_DN861_c0_g1~~TRINITY_DN861_c0_g1_i1.p1  ORF type:complete len:248 (+),score=44.27 TRINITY_DN861_c0_g1_i1:55-798(+)